MARVVKKGAKVEMTQEATKVVETTWVEEMMLEETKVVGMITHLVDEGDM